MVIAAQTKDIRFRHGQLGREPRLVDLWSHRQGFNNPREYAAHPVATHNVPDEGVYRPHAWAAFGTADLESADYRACDSYGPMY